MWQSKSYWYWLESRLKEYFEIIEDDGNVEAECVLCPPRRIALYTSKLDVDNQLKQEPIKGFNTREDAILASDFHFRPLSLKAMM